MEKVAALILADFPRFQSLMRSVNSWPSDTIIQPFRLVHVRLCFLQTINTWIKYQILQNICNISTFSQLNDIVHNFERSDCPRSLKATGNMNTPDFPKKSKRKKK